MNREIRLRIKIIRDLVKENAYYVEKELNHIQDILGLDPIEEEPTEEELLAVGVVPIETNWSAADEPAKDSVYMKDLKELTELKGLTIVGQIKTVFDLKSYIHPKTQQPGIIYRFVISDKTGDMTVISFDDMASELKQYTIGQILKITNAWKMEENKQQVMELHVGNFAKIEVVE